MRRLIFLIVVVGFPFIGSAQFEGDYANPHSNVPESPEDQSEFWDKVFVGGGLGAQFGTYTAVEVSPVIGYQINERLQAGLSFTYRYYEDKKLRFSTNTYGGGVFTRVFILENVFAHAEYEALNGEWKPDKDRYFINSLFIGGGYMQRIGNNFAGLMILYNINDSAYNPYINPVIRATFGIGF